MGTTHKVEMLPFGDQKLLTPQQIADVIAYIIDQNAAAPEAAAVRRPSNPGGAGPALELEGDAGRGAQVFVTNCQVCHGIGGRGGETPEAEEPWPVPPLVPAQESLADPDPKVFAENLDLFIEHGSTPQGASHSVVMLPFGGQKLLTPEQIADVIAYIIQENR